MPLFSVAAIDADGKRVEEILTVANRAVAVEIIRDRGLTPIKVTAKSGARGRNGAATRPTRLPLADLAFVFTQLAVLLKAGLELDRALAIVAGMASRASTQGELKSLRQSLVEGRSISEYMAAKPGLYPIFVTGAIRAGESSGALDVAFEQLGTVIERQIAVRRTIINSLVYPAFLIIGSFVSIAVLLVVVLPRFEPLFAESGAELPWPTKLLLDVSSLFFELAPLGLILAVLALVLGRSWINEPENRTRFDRFLLSVPVLGRLILKTQIARLALLMSALLRAGVPLLTALETSIECSTNRAVSRALERATAFVRDGTPLSQALMDQGLFPELFLQLIRVGEESARLDKCFQEVGEIYNRDVASDTQRILAMITPMTTIVLGLLVAGIIGAILSAVLKINDLAIN
jgi:general secretion pathway protein F